MAASKQRLQWPRLPRPVRGVIEDLAGGRVVAHQSQSGGFSPGLAARLTLANGDIVFAKAIDSAWPAEAAFHRREGNIAAVLSPQVPAPRLRGVADDGDWIALVFDNIDGRAPPDPLADTDLNRVLAAITRLSDAEPPSQRLDDVAARIGGWDEVAADATRCSILANLFPWAADRLSELVELDRVGRRLAAGSHLVHFDLYPHNILVTDEAAWFVDWPHAHHGNPMVDLITVLSPLVEHGVDPTPIALRHPVARDSDVDTLRALLAAHAGFAASGALLAAPRGHEAVTATKKVLVRHFIGWLRQLA